MERQGDWNVCLLCETKLRLQKYQQYAKPSSAEAPDTIPINEMGSLTFKRTSPTNSQASHYNSTMFGLRARHSLVVLNCSTHNEREKREREGETDRHSDRQILTMFYTFLL